MTTIQVKASKCYDVIIGNGHLPNIGQYASKLTKAKKVAIISDSNVWPIYAKTVNQSLVKSGFETVSHVFPAGEESKNGQTYLDILEFLAQNRLTRSDLIVALGGGVVGDITGFAAATYLRGISYIQVPTTLLSMVDSSVGGKTAIDLSAGKNLAGAFYQPSIVLCDTQTLETLPYQVFTDGCAEVIKYGILYDKDLFEHLYINGKSFDREYVISRCVELKRDVVANDEFDRGERQMLNLGHTIGHSIEALSDFTVTHGQAVAMGLAIISRASANCEYCNRETKDAIIATLNKFELPCSTKYSASLLQQKALSDKKVNGSSVNLIVPRSIADCFILPTPTDALHVFIEKGL